MGRQGLGKRDYVISADEKTSVQARVRRHRTLAPAAHRDMRVEHEYGRGGALQYLAAWDVHNAEIFGRCEAKTGIEPFERLVDQVMSVEPYALARRVFWVVDNGSSHRGQRACDRLARALAQRTGCPPAGPRLLANEVEIYFSIVQRKVLTPNDFSDLSEVEARLTAFRTPRRADRNSLRVEVHPQRRLARSHEEAGRAARLRGGRRLSPARYVIEITVQSTSEPYAALGAAERVVAPLHTLLLGPTNMYRYVLFLAGTTSTTGRRSIAPRHWLRRPGR